MKATGIAMAVWSVYGRADDALMAPWWRTPSGYLVLVGTPREGWIR